MRTSTITFVGALVVAFPALTQGQDTTPSVTQAPAAPAPAPKLGRVDFGYRAESISGDEARFNRLHDVRDGGYIDRFRFESDSPSRFFRAEANNVGYRDQHYLVTFQEIGRLEASFQWDTVPLLQVHGRSLFAGEGEFTLLVADGIQLGLQRKLLTPAQAVTQAQDFTVKSRRDVGALDMTYTAAPDLDLKMGVRQTLRNGSNLQALNFGNSPGNMVVLDMGVPIDDRTTDVTSAVEWASRRGLLSVGYDASWFNQGIPTFTWDNPLRYQDSATAGPAFGRTALWPTNHANTMHVNGSIKLPGRSMATAAVSYGAWSQNQTLLPNTTNTALVAPPVERASAEAKAQITSMVYAFTSRPLEALWLNADFRYYDYDNRTPVFENTVVPGDFAIGAHEETEPASFKRHTLDLDAAYSPYRYFGLSAGYTRENADRTWRIYEQTTEDVIRASIDSTGNRYVTARVKYEYSTRDGHHFDQELLTEIGEQSTLRHFDIAPRDRNRTTALLTITPWSFLDLNGSVFDGHDKYPASYFGLRDNKNRGYTVGFDLVPNEIVTVGMSYGFEKYQTLQWSRTANPPATDTSVPKQFNDPRRDWSLDTNDGVNTLSAMLDLTKAIRRTDIRLSYDLSDGNTNYSFGIRPGASIPTPVQYSIQPRNRIDVAKADVQYFIRPNVALGGAFWYEEYKVEDFALDPALIDPLALPSALYSGYAYRPYTARTAFVRMTYLW
jgi:MtrB/PioB family decaheme-associated outer membrane protein